jgi:PAS domain S-box-containing protein
MSPKASRHIWWILTLSSLITLGLWMRPSVGFQADWPAILIGALLIALLVNTSIPVGEMQVSLSHALGITLGIALGPGAAGLMLAVGMLSGELAHLARTLLSDRPPENYLEELKSWGLALSRQVLSLAGSLAVYLLLGGRPLVSMRGLPQLLPAAGFGICFGVLFLAFSWLGRLTLDRRPPTRREIVTLVWITLTPVPFGILSAATYAELKMITLFSYGGLVAAVSPVVRSLVMAERDLNRRVLELSTLSRVSEALRTSLDLETLLTTIYLQVSELIHVRSYYIALLQEEEQSLTYPFAMKAGRRQYWSDRPLADRLTDRVIQSGEPILLPDHAPQAMREMDLPELEDAPQAWLGVPLITPERTIGCMAIFHTDEGQTISETDLDLLVTIAGQAGVAIQNALLYDQTRHRAQALASLSEITTSMSSTLDPDRALELVGMSMIRVGGGQKSIILLQNGEGENLHLAWLTNLSDAFQRSWREVPLEDRTRAEAFFSGVPRLIPDVAASDLPAEMKAAFTREDIRAFADFPLITPSGTIGQISVYFSMPQSFPWEQVELLSIFAAHAALAVANARAHAATDEALSRRVDQLAALQAIGREMTATLNVSELFDRILHHALKMTDGACAYLATHDPEMDSLHVQAHHGCEDGILELQPDYAHPTYEGVLGVAFRSGEPITRSGTVTSEPRAGWDGVLGKSLLSVPILRRGKGLGVITVEAADRDVFGREQVQFLSQLAAQAGVAIANARLYQQLNARLREQSLLYQASTQIAGSLDREAVALAAADSIMIALSTDGARVTRWNPAQESLHIIAELQGDDRIESDRLQAIDIRDDPILTRCLDEGTPQQWQRGVPPDDPSAASTHPSLPQAGGVLGVPMLASGKTIGVIETYSADDRLFDENAVRTAQTIASQAAIALENTDLFRRIQESHNLLMAVLNSTREGMLMVDISGNVLLANKRLETLTDVKVEEVTGRNLANHEWSISEYLGLTSEELRNLITSEGHEADPTGGVKTFQRPGSARQMLRRTDTLVRDAAGELIGWLFVIRDVTEEYELGKAREQLAEMIVHDLRSPLTAILGSMKLLDGALDASQTTPVISQALSISQNSMSQMLSLVDSLLDIAKLESGELKILLEPLSLQQMLEELVESFIPSANENGIYLRSEIPEELPEIVSDEEKLRRVLTNLLDNAVKFTPAGGQVSLRAALENGSVVMTVADTGPGVPEEFRGRIFQRFGQVPGVAGKRRGTGLGLAFSKLAVDALGGEIWLEENEGGGSAFRIRLPCSGPSD